MLIRYWISSSQVNGGLMLIIGFVPDSEREYIQFLGRTARQDKRGQFAAVLLQSDYSAEAVGDFGDSSSGSGEVRLVSFRGSCVP